MPLTAEDEYLTKWFKFEKFKCLTNDTYMSVKKMEEMMLNDLIRKFDETSSTDWASGGEWVDLYSTLPLRTPNALDELVLQEQVYFK